MQVLDKEEQFDNYKAEKILFGLGFSESDLLKDPLRFSGGFQVRINLTKILLQAPDLLLLDEPVSGLDPIARMQFREVVKTLQNVGMTVLISSHVLSDLAELCTSVGIMELGFLVESTSLKELYERFSHQQIIIKTLGDLTKLEQELKGFSQVEEWEILSQKNSLRVNFSGGDEESAEI